MADNIKITCPAVTCRAPNDTGAAACARCGLPLGGLSRLTLYPSKLFNMGLAAAKENNMARARDLFASVVYWCPLDTQARDALAMACYASGDMAEARHHWEAVLWQSPSDAIAAQGLSLITAGEGKDTGSPGKKKNKAFKKKSRR